MEGSLAVNAALLFLKMSGLTLDNGGFESTIHRFKPDWVSVSRWRAMLNNPKLEIDYVGKNV
jgi:hypothetical protein